MHGDFDKLEVLMFCHTLTVRTVKSVRSIRGSALVHIKIYNFIGHSPPTYNENKESYWRKYVYSVLFTLRSSYALKMYFA